MNKKRKLAMQLMRLTRLFEVFLRHQRQKHEINGFNPYKAEGRILAILKMQPEILQKELGYLLDMSKQGLAEVLHKLEKKGYISREQSDKDRRSYLIKLTDLGREAIPEDYDDNNYDFMEDLFDSFSDSEMDNFINYLKRIILAIEIEVDEDDYATFFRERFFTRHSDHRSGLKGLFGFNILDGDDDVEEELEELKNLFCSFKIKL